MRHMRHAAAFSGLPASRTAAAAAATAHLRFLLQLLLVVAPAAAPPSCCQQLRTTHTTHVRYIYLHAARRIPPASWHNSRAAHGATRPACTISATLFSFAGRRRTSCGSILLVNSAPKVVVRKSWNSFAFAAVSAAPHWP